MEGSRTAPGASLGTKAPRWFTWLGFIVIPVLVVGAANRAVRYTVDRVPLWYGAADELAAAGPIDVVFLGSSRTAAAVPMDAFEQAVAERTGRRIRGINLGRGGATMIEHYLGMRSLIERHPESLRGVQVFVESTCGAPSTSTWRDEWVAQSPWMLAEVLEPGDLPLLWRSTGSRLETRLMLTARTLLHAVPVVARHERFREYATTRGAAWVLADLIPWAGSLRVADGTKRMRRLRHGPNPLPVSEAPLGDDLRHWEALPPGGFDPEALAAQRRFIQGYLDLDRAREVVRAPEVSILADLRSLVAGAGGRIFFHEIPAGTAVRESRDTPAHPINRRLFEAWAAAQGMPHLVPTFDYDDRDLTDRSHLDARRAPEFAAAVARAWLEAR